MYVVRHYCVFCDFNVFIEIADLSYIFFCYLTYIRQFRFRDVVGVPKTSVTSFGVPVADAVRQRFRDVVGVPKTSVASFGVPVADAVRQRFRDVEDAVPYNFDIQFNAYDTPTNCNLFNKNSSTPYCYLSDFVV